MEISVSSIALSVLFLTVLTWVWRVVNWVWIRPKKLEKCLRQQGLVGNTYSFLLGDIKELYRLQKDAKSRPIDLSDDILPRVSTIFYQSIKKYGKNSFTWFGPTPNVKIVEPALIREVLSRNIDFQKAHRLPLIRSLITGLLDHEGDKWAKHRKIINPAFHLEKLKLLLPAFHMSCGEMMSKWEMLISTKGSCELDVWLHLDKLSGDVISRAAFGSSYEEGKKIFKLIKEQITLTMEVLKFAYIPGWMFLPTQSNIRLKHVNKEVKMLLRGIVSKRQNAMKAGETNCEDLLGILINSNLKEIQESGNKKGFGMSVEDVIEECKAFYLAGQETTSVFLTWTMVLLGKHQDWQARAREEVFQVFGNKMPTFDGLNRLKTVTMILYEVLRLYPPIAMLMRTVHKKTKLGEMYIPPGVELSLPIIIIHRDPQIWGEDAAEFKPERFSDGVSKASNSRVPSFFTFGSGPRICIGQNFSMMEAKLALSMILQRFYFELAPSYKHGPYSLITLQPQYGVPVILHKI